MPPCLSLLTWRLLPHLDEELYGPLGDVEQRGPARDEGLLLHGRRRVHQEHDDRHDGAGEATEKEGWDQGGKSGSTAQRGRDLGMRL